MTQTAERLKSELAQLSTQERAELAYYLLHSLDETVDAEAEAAWDAELAERMAEIRSGKVTGEPAGKVFNELRRKYFVKPVLIHSKAQAEIGEAVAYYESRKKGCPVDQVHDWGGRDYHAAPKRFLRLH